jgi:hypothetical protein
VQHEWEKSSVVIKPVIIKYLDRTRDREDAEDVKDQAGKR